MSDRGQGLPQVRGNLLPLDEPAGLRKITRRRKKRVLKAKQAAEKSTSSPEGTSESSPGRQSSVNRIQMTQSRQGRLKPLLSRPYGTVQFAYVSPRTGVLG
jgi:hypothetical protein